MYKKMYLHLFNAVTDSLEDMAHLNYGQAYERLCEAQVECENIYMDFKDGTYNPAEEAGDVG